MPFLFFFFVVDRFYVALRHRASCTIRALLQIACSLLFSCKGSTLWAFLLFADDRLSARTSCFVSLRNSSYAFSSALRDAAVAVLPASARVQILTRTFRSSFRRSISAFVCRVNLNGLLLLRSGPTGPGFLQISWVLPTTSPAHWSAYSRAWLLERVALGPRQWTV